MQTETLFVPPHDSRSAKQSPLVLSVGRVEFSEPRKVAFIVGAPGLPGIERIFKVGEAVLFETPNSGLLEVRVYHIIKSGDLADARACYPLDLVGFLISEILPRAGLTAGVKRENFGNESFAATEVARIRGSLEAVQEKFQHRTDVTPEQIDYISRKLDEIADAANRLGRKDWVNLVIGTLTNTVVQAAINSDAGKILFQNVGEALGWLLGQSLKLLT